MFVEGCKLTFPFIGAIEILFNAEDSEEAVEEEGARWVDPPTLLFFIDDIEDGLKSIQLLRN